MIAVKLYRARAFTCILCLKYRKVVLYFHFLQVTLNETDKLYAINASLITTYPHRFAGHHLSPSGLSWTYYLCRSLILYRLCTVEYRYHNSDEVWHPAGSMGTILSIRKYQPMFEFVLSYFTNCRSDLDTLTPGYDSNHSGKNEAAGCIVNIPRPMWFSNSFSGYLFILLFIQWDLSNWDASLVSLTYLHIADCYD